MKGIKIIDLMKNEKPFDFEGKRLILITGIIESTLNEAIKIAESAREAGVVTVGIPAGNMDSGNEDIRRFSDIADAVIFTREKTESTSRRIAEELSGITERNGDILDIPTMRIIFRNAGTVYYGSGVGDDIQSAIRKAAEMCRDIHGAKRSVYEITTPKAADSTDEFYPGENMLKDICGGNLGLSFSICRNSGDEKFTANIFALMYDAGYTDWKELFANESEENITAMIENGLDERTRTRLGSEKSFFAACMRFGTPELVRKFISKGHNPKELETDGIFSADILADCVKILVEAGADVNAREISGRTPMMYIDYAHNAHDILKFLLANGADINATAEDGTTAFTHAAKYICARPDIVRTFLNAGANVNAEFIDNAGKKSVLDIMFDSAASIFQSRKTKRYFCVKSCP